MRDVRYVEVTDEYVYRRKRTPPRKVFRRDVEGKVLSRDNSDREYKEMSRRVT